VPHVAPVVEPPPVTPPAAPIVTRNVLQRPDGSPLGDARGVVVAVHGEHGDALRCEVGHLSPNTSYGMFVGESGAGIAVGDVTTNGEGGGQIVREAAAGAALTDHLPSLADIAGRRVEIRDHEGHVVLFGEVPGAETPHDAEPVHHEEEHHDADTGADAHVVVEIHPEQGHERLRIELHDLPREHAQKAAGRAPKADVLLEDGTGTLQTIATVRVSRNGRARVRYNTRRGDSLPFGVGSVRDLAGRAFEVQVGGVKAVGGNLPNF
jgi:hypothetical protein